MRSSRFSTLRERARRPLRLRLLSIVTSDPPSDERQAARDWDRACRHDPCGGLPPPRTTTQCRRSTEFLLCRSCERDQCKRLFARLSTVRTGAERVNGNPGVLTLRQAEATLNL